MVKHLQIVRGDITQVVADAIVNAANSSLLGGGGVDGAIHRAGGLKILEECRAIRSRQGSLPAGQAVITTAGNLHAKYVIHTVGPVWNGGTNNERALLASCYQKCLELAEQHQLNSIAFPAISTGVYRFPKAEAAQIAMSVLHNFEAQHVEVVKLVCFDPETAALYSSLIR